MAEQRNQTDLITYNVFGSDTEKDISLLKIRQQLDNEGFFNEKHFFNK